MSLSGGPAHAYGRALDGPLLTDDMTGNGVVSNAAISYSYAANGTLSGYTHSWDGGVTSITAMTRDSLQRLRSLSNAPIQATYGYAPGFSLATNLTVTNAGGWVLAKQIQWDFHNRRMTNISYWLGTNLVYSYAYRYVANDDRIEQITREDGTTWNYSYTAQGRLSLGGKQFADGTPWQGREYGYAYDGAGNTREAGPLRATTQQGRYHFLANLNNIHTTRTWDTRIPIGGTVATNARVVVNDIGTWRKDGWFHAEIPVDNANGPVE